MCLFLPLAHFPIALSTLTILRDYEFLIQMLFPVVLVETTFNLSVAHLFTLFRVSLLYRSLQCHAIPLHKTFQCLPNACRNKRTLTADDVKDFQ